MPNMVGMNEKLVLTVTVRLCQKQAACTEDIFMKQISHNLKVLNLSSGARQPCGTTFVNT